LYQVYVSVKLRSQQGNMAKRPSLYLYPEETARQKHEELECAKKTSNVSALAEIGQVEPPGPQLNKFEVVVSHVNSPSSFWVHFKDSWENPDLEDRLQFSIGELVNRNKLMPVDKQSVAKGEFYLVLWSEEGSQDMAFYRGKVLSLDRNGALVFFIDYGNSDVVKYEKIMEISEEMVRDYPNLVKTPGLALECYIAELQPNRAKNSKKVWDSEAIACFGKILEEGSQKGRLIGEIYSVVRSGNEESKWLLALKTIRIVQIKDADDFEVRQWMLEKRLAEPSLESYISKRNHQERKEYAQYNEAMKDHLRSFAKHKTVKMPRFDSDPSKQNLKVSLTGPFSPLEHKVTCAYRQGACKMTNLDPDSVNVVMLDQSPGDPCEQWMVAAHVGMSPNGDTLLARNTSWLPARPGFGPLAMMMFSPVVELRANKERTRLTGFISGLGPKPWKNRGDVTAEERTHAMYPEHDVECKFDCDVTLEDVNNVNKVRYYINSLLSKGDDGMMTLVKPKALDSAHRNLKSCLNSLLHVERKHKEQTHHGKEFRWNLLQQSLRMPSETVVTEPVLTLIDGIRLKICSKLEAESKIEMVGELRNKASILSSALLPRKEVCPCSPGVVFETAREIAIHLKTKRHEDALAEWHQIIEEKISR